MNLAAAQWASAQELPRGPQHTLSTLASFTKRDGWAYCTQREIAERMGAGERTVRRHLATLEQRGLIRRVHRYPERAGRLADGYQLLFSTVDNRGGLPAKMEGVYRPKWPQDRGGSTGQNGRFYIGSNGDKEIMGKRPFSRTGVDNGRLPPRRSGELERIRIVLSPEDEALLA